jgi:hypothetical protein
MLPRKKRKPNLAQCRRLAKREREKLEGEIKFLRWRDESSLIRNRLTGRAVDQWKFQRKKLVEKAHRRALLVARFERGFERCKEDE